MLLTYAKSQLGGASGADSRMYVSKIGPFDGNSWEALCQLVFKSKFGHEGYQEMVASPGDFGIEGFTLDTGRAFQCYCPDKNLASKDLYEAQRDKMTVDLGKLRTYQSEIKRRIGDTKIREWIFLSPDIDRNALLAHAREKEKEVQHWNLGIIASDFRVLLHDAGNYHLEINEIRSSAGQALCFDPTPVALPPISESPEQLEENIRRKSKLRLSHKAHTASFDEQVERLHGQTLRTFLGTDDFLRNIENSAPTIYFRLLQLLNEFENNAKENSLTWSGAPEELTSYVREGLAARITKELGPQINETTASRIARHVVARWLAICQLDYE